MNQSREGDPCQKLSEQGKQCFRFVPQIPNPYQVNKSVSKPHLRADGLTLLNGILAHSQDFTPFSLLPSRKMFHCLFNKKLQLRVKFVMSRAKAEDQLHLIHFESDRLCSWKPGPKQMQDCCTSYTYITNEIASYKGHFGPDEHDYSHWMALNLPQGRIALRILLFF